MNKRIPNLEDNQEEEEEDEENEIEFRRQENLGESTKLNLNNYFDRRTSTFLYEPPDGGTRAIAVVIGSFLTNGLLFGVINSYGSIHCVLVARLRKQNVANYESKSALVGSLSLGFIFLLSPIAGALTAVLGPRITTVLGGSIAATSLFISSFVVNYVNALCVTYGAMYGLGASMAYTPSLAILADYFKRYLGLANGFAAIGGSIFTIVIPPLMEFTLKTYGLEVLFRILAALTVGIILCGFLFKPIKVIVLDEPNGDENKVKVQALKSVLKNTFNLEIWKIKKYRYWALFMPIALFGYFVPYVQMKNFVHQQFPDKNDNTAIMCIGASSAFGSLLFGFLADRKNLDKVVLQQTSFYAIGSFTMLLPFVDNFCLLIIITLCMGLVDGAITALIGPIAIGFCGKIYAAQAIGCMLGLVAAPLSLGPPLAGYMLSLTKTYTLPFLLAGIMPIIGASLMFIIRFQKP